MYKGYIEKGVGKNGTVKSSKRLTYGRVSQLVSLVKLPDEVQDFVHKESLRTEPAYILSQLAFDLNFPNIGGSKSVKVWLKKNSKAKWDFVGTEPSTWKEERSKYQLQLVEKWIK